MSIKKILVFIVSALVAACPVQMPLPDLALPPVPVLYASQGQDAAAADPNLMFISPRSVVYVTEEAHIGSLVRSVGFDARLHFPKTVSILVPRDGMFASLEVGAHDWVEEGDPIISFTVVSNDLEIDEAALALELAESAQRREIDNLETALTDARSRLEAAKEAESTLGGLTPAPNVRRAELAVQAAEANLEFTAYNGERNLDFMRARLEDMRVRNEGFTIYAPISGYIYDLVYFAVGRSVPAGQFVCRISDTGAFQMIVSGPNLTQLRLGAQVVIETSRRDSPEFTGRVVGNSTLLGRNETDSRAIIAFDDPEAFLELGGGSIHRLIGFRYRAGIQQADIQNVLLIPRRAVSNEASYRFVNILEDGLAKKRYVVVGLTNADYAQILDGLEPGDVVIIN